MATMIKNFDDFKKKLESNTSLQQEFQKDPIAAIGQVYKALDEDKWVYRIVVGAMGLSILLIIVGVIVLLATGTVANAESVPTIFTAIGSAAIGALAGLLAPSPRAS